jgi:hypothetical protein
VQGHAFVTVVALILAPGCATSSQDLGRARHHYDAHEFAKALAVLRVLGEDEDALGDAERAQYAYLRGMTDLRLADTVSRSDPRLRQALRRCARDWLMKSVSAPATKDGTAALSTEQTARARAAIAELAFLPGRDGSCLPDGE